MTAGDPGDFCHRLKVARYYTADEALYTRGVTSIMHYLDGRVGPDGEGVAEIALAGRTELMNATLPAHDPIEAAEG